MPIETGSWYTEYRNEPSRSDLAASSEMQMQCSPFNARILSVACWVMKNSSKRQVFFSKIVFCVEEMTPGVLEAGAPRLLPVQHRKTC